MAYPSPTTTHLITCISTTNVQLNVMVNQRDGQWTHTYSTNTQTTASVFTLTDMDSYYSSRLSKQQDVLKLDSQNMTLESPGLGDTYKPPCMYVEERQSKAM